MSFRCINNIRHFISLSAIRNLSSIGARCRLQPSSIIKLRRNTLNRYFYSAPSLACKTDGGVELGRLRQKLHLAYTCNVCEVRSAKTISRQSYENGVVLVRCDGCESLHLIADNLGWFSDTKVNIEDIIKEKGGEVRKVANADEIEFLPN